jgi:hypothetical protein
MVIWCILWLFCVFCGYFVYFVVIWCILWLFGIFSPFWYVCSTKKNLATMVTHTFFAFLESLFLFGLDMALTAVEESVTSAPALHRL